MIHPAYLAGIIDGEGSISAFRSGNHQTEGLWHSFTIRVQIANTDLDLLGELKANYGGTLWTSGKQIAGQKKGFKLVWKADKAVEIIDTVMPYLICKRAVAERVRAMHVDFRAGPRRPRTMDEIIDLNQRKAEIKALNKRGA